MAAKPASTPRWANSGGVITEPSSGKKDEGWEEDERPPFEYFNWLFNLIYQWCLYLFDGQLSGAHTFDNTVGITGLLTATAGITVGNNQHITLQGVGEYKHGVKTRTMPMVSFF